jgi:hypothetical protein
MNEQIPDGTRRIFDGTRRVYYDGYWIRCYEPPADTLSAKKQLIQALTRRLFNHMEHGINIPGRRLDEVRAAYDAETEPGRKRVKGAMLAGALFNRAADIFTKLVELEACGVRIGPDNDLMHECGQCLREALEFGKMVKHRNGDEGIDELWGEPFKAFTMPIEEFYESRYVKIAMTMRNIDQIAAHMAACCRQDSHFHGVSKLVQQYAEVARRKCETLRTDHDIFDVWSDFVVAGEAIREFDPSRTATGQALEPRRVQDGQRLLREGVRLIGFVTRARTPMPQSTARFLTDCNRYCGRPG